MAADDWASAAIKPPVVDVSPINPFVAGAIFAPPVLPAVYCFRPVTVAHGTVSPGSTLLALRCALTL